MTDVRTYVVNVEAFVWHEGRYLVIERGHSEEIAPGALTPPGGKVEAGADEARAIEATLIREVREEVGVTVAEPRFVESHTFEGMFEGEPLVVLDLVWLCRYVDGEPRAEDPEEIAGIHWVTASEWLADARTIEATKVELAQVEAVRHELGWH